MPAVLKVFLWGLLISFLGSLPLGTLNITAMQIGIQESIAKAFEFAIGALVVEMVYVRLSLIGINWVRKQQRMMKVLEWVTFFIILLLAAGSFMAAAKTGGGKNMALNTGTSRFLTGVVLSALNPIQIPFWFGWSSILFEKKILESKPFFYNAYIVGIGIGTLVGSCVFILGGKYAADHIGKSQAYLNWIIGGIFLVTAVIQLYQLLFKKTSLQKLESREDD